MNRSRLLFFLASMVLILPLVAGNLSARDKAPDDDSFFKHLAVFTEVFGLVNQAYVEPPNDEILMAGALDGATDALDPFSLYVPEEGTRAYEAARQVGDRRSGVLLLRERGVVYVVGVAAGSPASEAGVQVGDMVAEVQGEATRLMPLWKIQTTLAGEAGQEVSLKIYRNQETLDLKFSLGTFEVPALDYSVVDKAGVLKFSQVASPTLLEVARALEAERTRGGERLLLDLRGVSAGEAEVAYEIAGLFAEGDLGSLKNRDDQIQSFQGSKARWQGSKLVLLIDRGTLGAAEVLATVLRQKLNADLVGERSFGYAGRARRVELSSGGHLWLTDAFYTGPDGEPLRGSLLPDLMVSSRSWDFDESEAEKKDLIFERGLDHLMTDEQEEKAAA